MRRQKRHRPHSPRSIRPIAPPSPWSVFAQHGRVYPRVPISLPPSPDADQDAIASYVLAMAPLMAEIMWLIRDWDRMPWSLAELREQWTQQHGYWPETAMHRGVHALRFCGLMPSSTWYTVNGMSRTNFVTMPRGIQFQCLLTVLDLNGRVKADSRRGETWLWDLLGLEAHWMIEADLWTGLAAVVPYEPMDSSFDTAHHPVVSAENLARARRALKAKKPSADPVDALYRAVGRVAWKSA
jgi:hypothetical protein